jgi:hypothetical protein
MTMYKNEEILAAYQGYFKTCQLYNRNKGKKKRQEIPYWNEEYGGFDFTGKVPTTIVVRMRDMEVDWAYKVNGCRKINDSRLLMQLLGKEIIRVRPLGIPRGIKNEKRKDKKSELSNRIN